MPDTPIRVGHVLSIDVPGGEPLSLAPVGPQVIYIDPDGRSGPIVHQLTAWPPFNGGSTVEFEMDDRTRALVRALLHLAQDRMDASNPHD